MKETDREKESKREKREGVKERGGGSFIFSTTDRDPADKNNTPVFKPQSLCV